ncbi:MAG TPA: copper chaperone PCu(A)C [Longimicrobiales bacterium]|nr:copper chaperone PCu(A)C [Longimicrobiales bacterium]
MLGRASAIERAGVVLLAVAAVGGCGGATDGGEAGRGEPGQGPAGEEFVVHRAGGIEVTDPVITEPVAGGAGALYLRLANRSGESATLIGLWVDGADASLHRTETREGRSVMRPVEEIDLSPGAGVRLRPGGFHGMIRWSGEAAVAGDTVAVGLRFEGRPLVTVPAEVVNHAEALERHPPGGP